MATKNKKAQLELMEGLDGGQALYLNGYRIAGQSDLGYMHLVRQWDVRVDDVIDALKQTG